MSNLNSVEGNSESNSNSNDGNSNSIPISLRLDIANSIGISKKIHFRSGIDPCSGVCCCTTEQRNSCWQHQLLGGGEQQEAPRAAHADALARSAAGLRRLAVLHFESLFARLHPKRTPPNWMQWKRVLILLYYTMIM